MFQRFRDSLVYPKRLIQYRKDGMFRLISYMLLFAILMTSATFVLIMRFDRIPENIRDVFKDGLKDTEIPCVIENNEMTCEGEEEYMYELYNDSFFVINVQDNPTMDEYGPFNMVFVFTEEGAEIYYAYSEYKYTYDELSDSFEGLDFRTLETSQTEFSDQLLDGLGDYLVSIKYQIMPYALIGGVIGNLFMVTFVTLMNAAILKTRFRIIPFKETFTFGVYLGTIFYILLIVNSFFGLGIFGLIVFLFISLRQTNQISLEIMRIIKK